MEEEDNEEPDDHEASPSPSQEDNDKPIALQKGVQNRRPPDDWWKMRESTPILSSSDDDDDNMKEAHVSTLVEPRSFSEAMKTPEADHWREAALEEINAQLANGTWKIVKLPPGKKAIGSK